MKDLISKCIGVNFIVPFKRFKTNLTMWLDFFRNHGYSSFSLKYTHGGKNAIETKNVF